MTNKKSHDIAGDDGRSATKRDIRRAVDELAHATKRGIDDLRAFVEQQAEETRRHFDVVAENIHQDVAGANRDEITLIQDKQHDQEERMSIVEQKVGQR